MNPGENFSPFLFDLYYLSFSHLNNLLHPIGRNVEVGNNHSLGACSQAFGAGNRQVSRRCVTIMSLAKSSVDLF